MRKTRLFATVLVLLLATASASGAPIDILVRLDPGQSAAVYSWSLLITVEEGYDVGGVGLMTTGFTSFTPNPANLGIGVLDSVYSIDPLEDGRNALILNNYANGVSIAAGGSQNVLLGTFFGPHATAPPVIVENCDLECGYTVLDPFLRLRAPGEESLSVYPSAFIRMAIVPEPGLASLALAALASLAAVRTSRRRAA